MLLPKVTPRIVGRTPFKPKQKAGLPAILSHCDWLGGARKFTQVREREAKVVDHGWLQHTGHAQLNLPGEIV
jgi:hypothetical protein